MTASGDRQRGDLLAATGENPMTVDTCVKKRTADGSADRHAWSSAAMGENAGA